MMLDGVDAESRGDVGLAGTGTADQDDVVRVVEELADLAAAGDAGGLTHSAWPAEALAGAAWALASDAAADVDERVVAGASVLPSLVADARSEKAVGTFFASRVESSRSPPPRPLPARWSPARA